MYKKSNKRIIISICSIAALLVILFITIFVWIYYERSRYYYNNIASMNACFVAEEYINEGEYIRAIKFIDKSLEADINNAAHLLYALKGDALVSLEDYSGAKRCYRKALEILRSGDAEIRLKDNPFYGDNLLSMLEREQLIITDKIKAMDAKYESIP